jgi:capsular polysaccharide transport system permease protein
MEAAIATLVEAERLAPDERSIRDLRLSWLGEHGAGRRGRPEQAGRPIVLPPMPRAQRRRHEPDGGRTFLESIAIQSRVLSALVMREFRHRAAHSRFGLLTVFIPVALNIFTLGVVMSVFNHGRAPIGEHLFFFYATGVMPFYLFLHVVDHSQNLFLDSTSVLQIPIINRLDLVLSAAIAELLIMTAAVVVTFGIFALISYGPQSDNQIECVFAMVAVWLFAFGVGLISAVMTNLYRPWAHGWLIVQRFLYFLSGVFFIPLNMPGWVREPLSWNPLLQGIEWFRTGFFVHYDPPWLSKSYLVGAAFATIIVGLMLERGLRRKMKAL